MSIAALRLELTIHKGRGLVAKDTSVVRKSTSDPYVEVHYADSLETASSGATKVIGKTIVVLKSLDPQWEFSVKHKLKCTEAEHVRTAYKSGLDPPAFVLQIFDWDKVSKDDSMGQVTIPISYKESFKKKWFKVESGCPKNKQNYCKNAKGEICVSLRVTAKRITNVIRGNIIPISAKAVAECKLCIGLGWELMKDKDGNIDPVDLDLSCAAIGTSGEFIKEDTVFYSQLKNSNGSVVHSGDDRTGEEDLFGSSDDERIAVDLSQIPSRIVAYIVVITVATPGMDFSRITTAKLRVVVTPSLKGVVCSYSPSGEHTALFALRIARNIEGGWSLGPIGDFHPTARDFGSLLPQIRGYCRDLVPDIQIDPNERFAVMKKDAVIRLADYAPVRNVLPDTMTLGLSWDVTDGVTIDLDASAICLDADLKLVDLVYFRQLNSNDGAIRHSGDEEKGDALGDDEQIVVSLQSVDPRVEHICFLVNSYSKQELDDVSSATCHLYEPKTGRDLFSYTLTNNEALDKHTALIVADIYRCPKISSDWYTRIIAKPTQGRTAHGCVKRLQEFLRENPSLRSDAQPAPEGVKNKMPKVVRLKDSISFLQKS